MKDNDALAVSIGGFTNGLRVVDMAKGYSTLANGGVYSNKTCILKIESDKDGVVADEKTIQNTQVFREDTAFIMTDILKGTMNTEYGTGRGLQLKNKMPAAGKTGTSNGSRIPGSAAIPNIIVRQSGLAMICRWKCRESTVPPMPENLEKHHGIFFMRIWSRRIGKCRILVVKEADESPALQNYVSKTANKEAKRIVRRRRKRKPRHR